MLSFDCLQTLYYSNSTQTAIKLRRMFLYLSFLRCQTFAQKFWFDENFWTFVFNVVFYFKFFSTFSCLYHLTFDQMTWQRISIFCIKITNRTFSIQFHCISIATYWLRISSTRDRISIKLLLIKNRVAKIQILNRLKFDSIEYLK